jgi:hypothetical protein
MECDRCVRQRRLRHTGALDHGSINPLLRPTIDRVIRAVLGTFLVSLAFWGPKTPLGFIGLILIATAGMSFCPLYRLVGISTCPGGKCEA